MQDTVEVQVQGLTEQILAEDEKLRAQELVCVTKTALFMFANLINRMYLTSLQNDQTGT